MVLHHWAASSVSNCLTSTLHMTHNLTSFSTNCSPANHKRHGTTKRHAKAGGPEASCMDPRSATSCNRRNWKHLASVTSLMNGHITQPWVRGLEASHAWIRGSGSVMQVSGGFATSWVWMRVLLQHNASGRDLLAASCIGPRRLMQTSCEWQVSCSFYAWARDLGEVLWQEAWKHYAWSRGLRASVEASGTD